jgi:hypothetical protein
MFGPLPVYHPLELIEDSDFDFDCTTKQIVIGGGSGEHPGLVVKLPNVAVAHFLLSALDTIDDEFADIKSEWKKVIEPYLYNDKALVFSNWNVENYHNFFELCKSKGLQKPFNEDASESCYDVWLLESIGEFIFYSMPELAKEIMENINNPYRYFNHILFNNIMLIPPNMPVYSNKGNAWQSNRANQL